jgi:hypothetical protein
MKTKQPPIEALEPNMGKKFKLDFIPQINSILSFPNQDYIVISIHHAFNKNGKLELTTVFIK